MVAIGVWAVMVHPAFATSRRAAKCLPGTTLQVDKTGQEDLCYARVTVFCRLAVKVDEQGEIDLCGVPAAAGGTATICAHGYDKKVQRGKDHCEYAKPPTCVTGTLTVQAGADVCR